MTDPTTTIPSDLRTHRHPTQIDDDGRLFALEITGGRLQPRGVILMNREGGIVMIPELTIEQLQRPTADEPGAGRLAAALKRLNALEIDDLDGAEALPIDRLEAAIEEYVYYLHNVKPDLAGWHKDIQEAEEERRKIRALAIDVITSGDPSKDMGGGALDLVDQVCRYATAWRDGASGLAREGLLEIGAARGPGEFFASLRAVLRDRDLWRAVASDLSGAAVEFFKGETPEPDPFMLTAKGDRAVSQVEALAIAADRYRRDLRHYEGTVAGIASDRIAELEAEVARLTRELASEQQRIASVLEAGRIGSSAVPDDFDPKPVIEKAKAAARGVLELLAPESIEGVRVAYPGAAILRVLVPVGVAEDVLTEIESEVARNVGGDLGEDVHVIVECEPGKPPAGWKVVSSSPGPWAYFLDGDEGSPTSTAASEAEAVDGAWREEASEMEREA